MKILASVSYLILSNPKSIEFFFVTKTNGYLRG